MPSETLTVLFQLEGLKTFEEDISDVEGVKSSFSSYKQFIDQNSKNTLSIPGLEHFNDKQIFFIS